MDTREDTTFLAHLSYFKAVKNEHDCVRDP